MRDFERRSITSLRSSFPDKLGRSSEEDILIMIRSGLAKASVYGVVNETDVTRYFEYIMEYGPEFDSNSAWAVPILTSQWMTGFEKMNELDNLTTFELRNVR
jgi:hypothetical protein